MADLTPEQQEAEEFEFRARAEEEARARQQAANPAPAAQGPVAPEFSDYSTLPASASQLTAGAQIPIQMIAEHPTEAAALAGLYKAGQVGNAYIQGKQTEAEALKQRAAMAAQTQAEHQALQRQKLAAKTTPVAPTGVATGPVAPAGTILGADGKPIVSQTAQAAQVAEAEAAKAAQAAAAAKAAAGAEQSFTNKIRNKAASMITGLAEASPMLAGAGRMAGKVLPGAGAALGGMEAYNRAKEGDYLGAGLAGAGGLASFVPGIGTAIGMGTTAINAGRDYQKYLEAKRQYEAQQRAMGQ